MITPQGQAIVIVFFFGANMKHIGDEMICGSEYTP